MQWHIDFTLKTLKDLRGQWGKDTTEVKVS
jgi:hypothetical protein